MAALWRGNCWVRGSSSLFLLAAEISARLPATLARMRQSRARMNSVLPPRGFERSPRCSRWSRYASTIRPREPSSERGHLSRSTSVSKQSKAREGRRGRWVERGEAQRSPYRSSRRGGRTEQVQRRVGPHGAGADGAAYAIDRPAAERRRFSRGAPRPCVAHVRAASALAISLWPPAPSSSTRSS